MKNNYNTPDDFDYRTSPIEEVHAYHLDRLKMLKESMEHETKLCEHFASSVIAEFNFNGDFQSVLSQLSSMINELTMNPLTEDNRAIVISRYQTYMEFRNTQKNLPSTLRHKKAITDCVKGIITPEELETIRAASIEAKKSLHEKKECICYNNF